jgi:hypothetical protein
MTAVQVDRDNGCFGVIDPDRGANGFKCALPGAQTCGRHGMRCLAVIQGRIVCWNEEVSQRKLHTLFPLHIISAPSVQILGHQISNTNMDFWYYL